jgi:hypothetical protein
VPGQTEPTATVTLTAAAPAGGATVRLESNAIDVARVPASVTVPAGSTTTTFRVTTATVDTRQTVTLTATYGDVARTATLVVLLPRPRASFTVTSPELGGDRCKMIELGSQLDCRLDGSGSDGRIVRWFWSLESVERVTADKREPFFGEIDVACKLVKGASTNEDSNGRYTTLNIRLEVTDKDGDQNTASRSVRLYVNGVCDF